MEKLNDQFFPDTLVKSLPPIWSQFNAGLRALVHARFYSTQSRHSWYVMEYDPESKKFFGFTTRPESKTRYFGYFELDELRQISQSDLKVQRDTDWRIQPLEHLLCQTAE